jgi:hypothetical protein
MAEMLSRRTMRCCAGDLGEAKRTRIKCGAAEAARSERSSDQLPSTVRPLLRASSTTLLCSVWRRW